MVLSFVMFVVVPLRERRRLAALMPALLVTVMLLLEWIAMTVMATGPRNLPQHPQPTMPLRAPTP